MLDQKSELTKKIDPTAYNRIVSHATIRDIRLIGTKFDLKPEAVELADQVWEFKLSDRLDEWTCDNEKARLTGLYIYTASCMQGRNKLLTVECRYLSAYTLSDQCDAEASKEFLTRVGRFAAYPYFRSVFASLTQQSGIMLPPLPVISDGPRWVNSPANAAKNGAPEANRPAARALTDKRSDGSVTVAKGRSKTKPAAKAAKKPKDAS